MSVRLCLSVVAVTLKKKAVGGVLLICFVGVAVQALPLWRSCCARFRRLSLKNAGGYFWDGERGGGQVHFYECLHCRARLKRGSASYENAGEAEWAHYV